MNLGISSYTYGWNVGIEGQMAKKSFDEQVLLKKTTDFGLNILQIGDNFPIHQLDENRKVSFRNSLKSNQVQLELGAKKLTEIHLQLYIDLCEFYEVSLLRFIIDDKGFEPKSSEVIALIKNFTTELTKKNITLGIENHDRLKVKELAEIMEKVGSPQVGICLDCVNSIGAGEGLEYVADVLAPYTVNLHIKDFTTKRLAHKMGFVIEGEIAGKGMTNVPWLLEKIKPYNRCKTAILEQWVPPTESIEETCQKEVWWAETGIEYLKNII